MQGGSSEGVRQASAKPETKAPLRLASGIQGTIIIRDIPALALVHREIFSQYSLCIISVGVFSAAVLQEARLSVSRLSQQGIKIPRPRFTSSRLLSCSFPVTGPYYTPHSRTQIHGHKTASVMSPMALLFSALARRDGGSGDGSTVSSDDSLGADWWWTSPIAYAVKWGIIAAIFVLFLAFFLIGHLHAQRRMKKGLAPLVYHRVR